MSTAFVKPGLRVQIPPSAVDIWEEEPAALSSADHSLRHGRSITAEGMAEAKEKNVFRTLCVDFTADAAKILDEIL